VKAPVIEGTTDPVFEGVRTAFESCFAEHGEIGAAVHVVVDGVPVVDLWGGMADPATARRWEPDTLVDVYSVGKAFVATLLLELVDDGVVGLDDTIAQHWPAFAAEGKESFTIRDALCHRAGVPAIREPMTNEDLADFDRMAAAVAATAPWWPRGARHTYHTNTYGHLVGGIIRAVSGDLPGTRLSRLAEMLGADLYFGVPDGLLDRIAELQWAGAEPVVAPDDADDLDPDQRMTKLSYVNPPGYSSMGIVNTRLWRQAQVPSTNGHASARGVAWFYDGLLNADMISTDLLAEATSPQSVGWCPTLDRDVTFGLGFQLWTQDRPVGRTPGSFGHFGTGGSLGFADPSHGISFGYVMNHVTPRWQSPRNRVLVDAVYAAVNS
jgi:CubicO group peptidase (beta-lactamase class C family)